MKASSALPVVDGKWRLLKSPHFELFTRNAEKESRGVLYNLEMLRAVFLEQLHLEERLHVDVSVFYFRTKREFDAYVPEGMKGQEHLAGFHLFLPDRAVISMAPTEDDEEAQRTIFHEYVHHLFRVTERNPPMWFNEGTAEVLAGIQVVRDHVEIGAPLEGRTIYLRREKLLPLGELFATEQSPKLFRDETHTGVFYAESWALLHFWHFGDSGFSKEAVDRFLSVAADKEAAAKTDLRKYFQSCFGCDYAQMESKLRSYILTGSYRQGKYPMPRIEPAASYSVRNVTAEEIELRLAELSVRVAHSPVGRLVLLNAITAHPNDPRPFEVLGTEAYLEKDEREAAQRWEQALAAGSQNPAVLRELALMEGRHWFERFDAAFRLPAVSVERLRSRLLQSISLEPRQGAAYEMLAWVEGFAEVPDASNINRIIAQLPSMEDKKRSLIGLSLVMIRLGKAENAQMLLKHLGSLRLDHFEETAASELRDLLAEKFPDYAVTREGETTIGSTIAPPPDAPQLKMPSVSLPDDL